MEWPLAGVPARPAAWLMTACRNRALNRLRDEGRARDRTAALAPLLGAESPAEEPGIPDDRLRLMFICYHPILSQDAAAALTLRMVGGLSTPDIARAWHVPEPTMAQRIVRAKRTLAQRRVPFEEPEGEELTRRLPAVLDVIYLIFNEGYLAHGGKQLTRPGLAAEAHRLARLLIELLPTEPEAWALRALIAFHRSRDDTDWAGIVGCYDVLVDREPSAVLALNRGVAVAMAEGPAAALPLLDALVTDPALARGHRVWSVRADLLRRLGERQGAAEDYDRALALVDNAVERRYLADARANLEES